MKEQKQKQKVTYSDGGRQQPASIGVSFADLYCLRVYKMENISQVNKMRLKKQDEVDNILDFQQVENIHLVFF